MVSTVSLDFETYSERDLKLVGLDLYSRAAEVLMCAYRFDDGKPAFWQHGDGPFPRVLAEALEDPHVHKFAFNAQFERVIASRALKLRTPIAGWRCTMALAYMQSFAGGLDEVGAEVGLLPDRAKLKDGKRLIRMFCGPQKITKKQPHRRRDEWTDPHEWEAFCRYCAQDEVAETALRQRLSPFPVPQAEWDLYELDQVINDRGMPVDIDFVRGAIALAKRRQDELSAEMRELTGLANPNSTPQLLPYLRDRGYPFGDIQKATVAKVLAENAVKPVLSETAAKVLRLRQWAARISTRKHNAVLRAVGPDGRIRYIFQFAGASRTNRWAGRRVQPQNMPRTPKALEPLKGIEHDALLNAVNDAIRHGDYEALGLIIPEPMEAIVGATRSMFRAPEGYLILVCDLAAIESRVIAWLAGCDRLIHVFVSGRDPYLDFGQTLYRCAYEDVTRAQRSGAKPAVLGAGFGLGGGELREGKKTGLWGYAESMGVKMTQAEAERAVTVFRAAYPEIPALWYALEDAAHRCTVHHKTVDVGPVRFEYIHPFMTVRLPSGRRLYYYKPRITWTVQVSKRTGKPFDKAVLSYMGQHQKTGQWVRLPSRGAKLCENLVQAIARDVLADGMRRSHEAGFDIIGHVHDEQICLIREGENQLGLEALRDIMREPIAWLPGIPLDAAGYTSAFYKKD